MICRFFYLKRIRARESQKQGKKNHGYRTTREVYQMVLKALKSQDLSQVVVKALKS